MSRIGKKIIVVPAGVTLDIKEKTISVLGPKGSLNLSVPEGLKIELEDNHFFVSRLDQSTQGKMNQGTTRQLIFNMIKGVTEGWQKELEIRGTGFRVALEGKDLVFNLGFSHPIKFQAVEGIDFEIKENKISVVGSDKSLVGLVAAKIRNLYPPDHYKGKGIRYLNEEVKLKPGKAAKIGVQGATGGK